MKRTLISLVFPCIWSALFLILAWALSIEVTWRIILLTVVSGIVDKVLDGFKERYV